MAISALNFKPSASPNWLAMTEAIVFPGLKIPLGIRLAFPISMVTAIVSPSALPSARI